MVFCDKGFFWAESHDGSQMGSNYGYKCKLDAV